MGDLTRATKALKYSLERSNEASFHWNCPLVISIILPVPEETTCPLGWKMGTSQKCQVQFVCVSTSTLHLNFSSTSFPALLRPSANSTHTHFVQSIIPKSGVGAGRIVTQALASLSDLDRGKKGGLFPPPPSPFFSTVKDAFVGI